jgi:hypothetical protein
MVARYSNDGRGREANVERVVVQVETAMSGFWTPAGAP